MEFKIKVIPEDFVVKEKHNLLQEHRSQSNQNTYFLLQKKNHETFEAILLVANFFQLDPKKIGYAGLKDCDGVTEQYISIETEALNGKINGVRFPCYHIATDQNKFVRLYNTGKEGEKISVASLEGNEFNITVRDVDARLCTKLITESPISTSFVNYYDTQRFGIPGGEKITHILGEALERRDYESSMRLINRIKDSQDIIENPLNSIDDFFARVDLRKIAFYRSSYSSFIWNSQIIELLENSPQMKSSIIIENQGLKYIFPTFIDDSIIGLFNKLQYKYKRHIVVDNEIVAIETNRPAIVTTNVTFGKVEPDDLNHGKYKFNISFFLPPGCYATMLIKQLITRLHKK